MELKNTQHSYGWLSIVLHWFMALMMFGMFGLGLYMVELTYMDVWYKTGPYWHISVGILLFLLLLARLLWRLINILPQALGNAFEKKLALLVHRTHYILMFTLMLSGYLIITADGRAVPVFTWFEVPALFAAEKGREAIAGQVHQYLAWGFMSFVALHATAAIKHHWVDKDQVLNRMLGIKKEAKKESDDE
ncbi:MAG: cytochrome b [Ghiorsea sp.]